MLNPNIYRSIEYLEEKEILQNVRRGLFEFFPHYSVTLKKGKPMAITEAVTDEKTLLDYIGKYECFFTSQECGNIFSRTQLYSGPGNSW